MRDGVPPEWPEAVQTLMREFGHVVAYVRDAKGWSQQKAGEVVGVHAATISRLEAGVGGSLPVLTRYLRELGFRLGMVPLSTPMAIPSLSEEDKPVHARTPVPRE